MKKLFFSSIFILTTLFSFSKTTTATAGTFWVPGAFSDFTWSNGEATTGDRLIIDFSGGSANAGGAALSLKTLIIRANSSFSFSSALTVTDSLIIEGTSALPGSFTISTSLTTNHIILSSSDIDGANFTTSGTTTINLTDSMIKASNGTFTYSTGTTISLTGSGRQSIYGGNYNLTIGKSGQGKVSLIGGLGGSGTATVGANDTLSIDGSFSIANKSLASGSTVEYSGSSQIVRTANYSNLLISGSNGSTESNVNVSGMLNVTNSATFTTSGNVTLTSDATQTAGIGDLSNGTVTGNVTCQRYVAAQSVAGNPGWWYMIGSPVNGQTLASLSDDLQTTGFTGATVPTSSFKSIVYYSPDSANANASASYYPKAQNITDGMPIGMGYYVYISSDGISSMPKTIDWTGSISENVTVTMDQAGAMSFNLVANPLPCAVSINAGTNGTNVTQSYFQDDAGNFVSGTGTLAMGEGIWFEVSADGATYNFNETDKLTSAEVDQFHKSSKKGTATVAGKELEIIIHRPYGHGDKARIILNDDGNATLNKDPYLDGSKIPNFYGYTNVSFTYGTEEFSLNQIPSNFAGPITFPIRFWRETAFNQNVQLGFEIKGVEDFKANGICLTLEEIATGNMIPLDKDYSTQVNWFDQNNQPLYNLHLTTSFEEAASDASCYGYNDGTVTANLNTTAKYDFYLTNLIGDTLQSEVGYVGNSYTFNNVNAGEYQVVVNDPNGCGMIARPVSIQEPDPVVSFFTTKTNTVDLDFNPSITFNNLSANAQNYFWRFGDGNTSSDESPTHTYQDSGAYKVEMIALNGTCADTSSKSINVIKSGSDVGVVEVEENPYLKLLQRNEQIEVRFDLPARESVNAQLFNNLGQVVWSSFGNTFQNEQIALELPSANTFYILNIKGETFETNYKLIRR